MTIEAAVRALNEVFNKHDVDKAVEMATDDVEFKNVSWDMTFTGKEGLRLALSGWIQAFPDVQVKITDLVACDDTAAYQYDFVGTNSGPIVGPHGQALPTGKVVDVKGAGFFKFRDGKVSSIHVYFDPTVGNVVPLDVVYT